MNTLQVIRRSQSTDRPHHARHQPAPARAFLRPSINWNLTPITAHIQAPQAVILDLSRPTEPALLYVFELQGDALTRMVTKLDYQVVVKGADGIKRKKQLNVLRTGSLVKAGDLVNPKVYVPLTGKV